MANGQYIYNTSTNLSGTVYPKIDTGSVPSGQESAYVSSTDWNVLCANFEDLRYALRTGKWVGYAAQGSDPAPSGISNYLWLRSDSAWVHNAGGTNNFFASGPTTAKGDLLVFNGTKFVVLARGSNNQVLTADSTTGSGLKWAAGGGGSSTADIFNILDYGAVGDGTTNDAPAIQAAFNAAAAAGGGTIYMPSRRANGSAALYAWKSAVSIDATPGGMGVPTYFELTGVGTTILLTAPGAPFLGLYCAQKIIIRGLRFYASMDTAHPSTPPNAILGVASSPTQLVCEDCFFGGFLLDSTGFAFGLDGDNSVITSPSLLVYRTIFAAISGSGRAAILAHNYLEMRLVDCWLMDFYILNGVTMSPTGGGNYVYSGIAAITPIATSDESHFAASSITIDNVRIDEGCGGLGEQIIIWRGRFGATQKCPFVRIRGLNQMVPNTSNSSGVRLDGVRHAEIEDWFVFNGSGTSVALTADVVDSIVLRRSFTSTGVYGPALSKVSISGNVSLVRAQETHLDLLTNNSALQTLIEGPTTPRNMLSFSSGGRPSASSLKAGSTIWNSSTLRPNVSNGSSWTDALGGIARYRYSFVDHVEKAVARGLDVTGALSAGGFTHGQAFYLTAPGTITGVQFYLPANYTTTYRVTLWKDSTRIESKDLAVSTAGRYTLTFNSSYPITGNDLYRRLVVTIWDTAGSPKIISFTPLTSPYSFQSYQAIPVWAGPGYMIEAMFFYVSGDIAPTTFSNSGYSGVEPIFTLD